MNIHEQRLLNVARACRETPTPKGFTMRYIGFPGKPMCALGNYAERRDLQDFCYLTPDGRLGQKSGGNDIGEIYIFGKEVAEHFGVSEFELGRLFGSSCGCNRARTHLEAAEYLTKFAYRKSGIRGQLSRSLKACREFFKFSIAFAKGVGVNSYDVTV